jgi:hypothetical protein
MPWRRLLKQRCYFIEVLAGIEQLEQLSDLWIDLVQRKNSKHAMGADSG